MLKEKNEIETFNSGILMVCVKENKRIKKNLIEQPIRYKNETLGVTRFYEARVADSKISRVISIPYQDVLKNEDRDKYVVLLDGIWYDIDMIQNKFNSFVPKVVLTLKKGGISYIDER